MTTLEGALVFLILIWTLIFIIFGVALTIILVGLKKSIDKINRILDNAENLTHSLNTPAKAAATAAGAAMGLLEKFLSNKSRKVSKK